MATLRQRKRQCSRKPYPGLNGVAVRHILCKVRKLWPGCLRSIDDRTIQPRGTVLERQGKRLAVPTIESRQCLAIVRQSGVVRRGIRWEAENVMSAPRTHRSGQCRATLINALHCD